MNKIIKKYLDFLNKYLKHPIYKFNRKNKIVNEIKPIKLNKPCFMIPVL